MELLSNLEFASNLAWLSLAFGLLAATAFGLRHGRVRLPAASALFLTVLLGLVLLPAISVSDDLLARQQSALPLAEQSWRMAVGGSELVTEVLLAVALPLAWMLFAAAFAPAVRRTDAVRVVRPVARWLTRSQRLRPPLTFSL